MLADALGSSAYDQRQQLDYAAGIRKDSISLGSSIDRCSGLCKLKLSLRGGAGIAERYVELQPGRVAARVVVSRQCGAHGPATGQQLVCRLGETTA